MSEAVVEIQVADILWGLRLPPPRLRGIIDEWAQIIGATECVLAGLDHSDPAMFISHTKKVRLPASARTAIRDLYRSPEVLKVWQVWCEDRTPIRREDLPTILGLIVWSAVRQGVGEIASEVQKELMEFIAKKQGEAKPPAPEIERPNLTPIDDYDMPDEEWWRRPAGEDPEPEL